MSRLLSSPVDQSENVVAIFDFDGTLTQRDSLLPFLWQVAGPIQFAWNAFVLLPTLLRYVIGTLENGAAKERVLARFLGGLPAEEVQTGATQFADQTIPSFLNPEAIDRLRWHQEQGHVTVLVSASLELYVEPWAENAGFDSIIGTRLETRDGLLTGKYSGMNCYGPEKVRRVRAEGPTLEGASVFAYGDSRGDRELLELADHGFYQQFDGNADTSPPLTDYEDTGGLPVGWQRGLLYSIVAGAVLYLGLTLWSGADQILEGLRLVPLPTLGGLLLLVFAGYLVRFGRWHWYLHRLGHSVPWRENLRVFLASFALTATPGKAGESIKAYFLRCSRGIPATQSLAGLFAERFTDVFSVVLVVCTGLFALQQGMWMVVGVGIAQIAVILALQRPRWLRRVLLLPIARWSRVRRWVLPINSMLDGTSALLRPTPLFGGVILGSIPWVAEGLALYVLFQALGAEAIAVHEAVLIHAAATLFGALTLLPGGLGGHEAASISLSLLYGASQPQAIVATVLIRLITLWFAVLIGITTLHFGYEHQQNTS